MICQPNLGLHWSLKSADAGQWLNVRNIDNFIEEQGYWTTLNFIYNQAQNYYILIKKKRKQQYILNLSVDPHLLQRLYLYYMWKEI